MKVAVLGGYGVFGSLLSELLCRDGHAIWIVGRDRRKADALAARFGCEAVAVDLRQDPERIFEISPEVVIDAAGPFQAYDGDPYAVPRLCLKHGVHYLDLSDSSDFTVGIGVFDAEARASGCWLLSGASSVPGLSSSVVAALAEGYAEIRAIDTAILPGNRAPRGASVIASIVSGVGRTMRVRRGGCWRTQRGWTDMRRYRLAKGFVRKGYLIDVPDIRLFPAAFGVDSVTFRAGLELGVMNHALSALAALRRVRDLTLPDWALTALRQASNLLRPFGTDRGGMQVRVTGKKGDEPVVRTWTLIADAGRGPYVPGIVARALLRRVDQIPPGARPCLAEVPLREIGDAMSDLSITTEIREAPSLTLFQTALADRWSRLPQEVQTLHLVQDVESFSGRAEVSRGASFIARFVAWFFGFPEAGMDVPVTVTKTRTDLGELWERKFGDRMFRSRCSPSPMPHRFRERFWWLTFELDLAVEQGTIGMPVRRGWFLGVPLPTFLLPGSDTREFVSDGVFQFDVSLSAPLGGGLIVRYSGSLLPDNSSDLARRSSRPMGRGSS